MRSRTLFRSTPARGTLLFVLGACALLIFAACQMPREESTDSLGAPADGASETMTRTESAAPVGAAGESDADSAEQAPPAEQGAPADEAAQSSSDDEAASSETAPAGAEPLAGDMLTDSESAAAEEAAVDAASDALTAATDRDSLGATADIEAFSEQPTYRVVYSQRYETKNEEPRSAEVGVYRYDTNEFVLTKVELESGEVTSLAVPPGYVAPLVPEEIVEAARVARRDEAVRSALEEDDLDPDGAVANGLLTTVAEEGDEVCTATRCVRLFFFSPDRIVPSFTVVVDVSNMEVVAIVPNMEPTSEGETP